MSGWSSNNKWAIFGTMRLVTQLVSYEIPLGLIFLSVTLLAGTLSMQSIVLAQSGWLWDWFVFRNPLMPVLFLCYFIASLAETKRAPFDLPEAESELVAGFHTEYSAMRFAMFFMSEYMAMFIVAMIASILFLGGWNSGLAPLDAIGMSADSSLPALLFRNLLGAVVLVSKASLLVFVQMWIRWTFPRIRLDQVMHFCWKVLFPFCMVLFVFTACWHLFIGDRFLIADVPVLGDFYPVRLAIFAAYAAAFLLLCGWFLKRFLLPFRRSLVEKPWDTLAGSSE
jgi:NADH-quinone oxidoreductase subunit H